MNAVKGWTPGPWAIGTTLRDGTLAVIGDGDSVVCEFPDRLGASVDADARLIAAAPELYEALVECVGLLEMALMVGGREPGEGSPAAKARAAIAKAVQP